MAERGFGFKRSTRPDAAGNTSPSQEDIPAIPSVKNPVCVSQRLTVAPDDIRSMRNRCNLDLGTYQRSNGTVESLTYALSKSEATSTSLRPRDEVLSVLLADWFDKAQPTDERISAINERCVKFDRRPSPSGLFFDDRPYWSSAIGLALLTLYAYADVVDGNMFAGSCNYSGDRLREMVDRGKRWVSVEPGGWCAKGDQAITVDSAGAIINVVRDFRRPYIGVTPLNSSIICGDMRIEAAIADYYFSWAQRLYSLDPRAPRNSKSRFLAQLCARAALSEIIEIAAVLLHEFSHIGGSKFECSQPGFPDKGLDCCHYVLEYVFRNVLWAKLGCVPSTLFNAKSSLPGIPLRPFGPGALQWTNQLNNSGKCGGTNGVFSVHTNVDPGHQATLTIDWPGACASQVAVAATPLTQVTMVVS